MKLLEGGMEYIEKMQRKREPVDFKGVVRLRKVTSHQPAKLSTTVVFLN